MRIRELHLFATKKDLNDVARHARALFTDENWHKFDFHVHISWMYLRAVIRQRLKGPRFHPWL